MSCQTFEEKFPLFKKKIADFIVVHGFDARKKQYETIFEQMNSVAPDDMRDYIERSPQFLKIRNATLSMMERIVSNHNALSSIFQSSQETLAQEYACDLDAIDKKVGDLLKQTAQLIAQYEQASEQGRKLLESLDDPFLAQGHSL